MKGHSTCASPCQQLCSEVHDLAYVLQDSVADHLNGEQSVICRKHCETFQVMDKNEQIVETAHFHAWHPMSVKSGHHQTVITCPVLAFTYIFDVWLHQRNTDGGKV